MLTESLSSHVSTISTCNWRLPPCGQNCAVQATATLNPLQNSCKSECFLLILNVKWYLCYIYRGSNEIKYRHLGLVSKCWLMTYCICVWFSSCAIAHKKALQRVINMVQKSLDILFSALAVLRGHTGSYGTAHTQDIRCLSCCRLIGGFRLLKSWTSRL